MGYRPLISDEMLSPLLRAITTELETDPASPLIILLPGLEKAIERDEFNRWKEAKQRDSS